MTLTIITVVALLFLFSIFVGFRFLYSLTINHSTNSSSTSFMKTKALDVFLYLGIAISLIVSVTNLLQIIFTAIDRRFVDLLRTNTYIDPTQSDVRFAIASLIVMFPIYVGLSWYTSRDITKFLYKQDIFVRKVTVYATLFVTILTLIGTLVSVIYNYLGGDLSVSFSLKAGSVFMVALSLFAYYYYSLKRDYSKVTVVPLVLTVVSSVLVIASIVWSISVIGSPKIMRAKKIDSLRLSDISGIQGQVLNRVQMTDKLPESLSELTNALQGYQVPVDPITKDAYGYKIVKQPVVRVNQVTNKKEMVSSAVFEICATFDTVRAVDARGQTIPMSDKIGGVDSFYSVNNYYYEGDISPFWNHDIGETCFKRIISPDMYYGR